MSDKVQAVHGFGSGVRVLSRAVVRATEGFPEALAAERRRPAAYVVKRGDTLSEICARTLKRQGKSATGADIAAAVAQVAEHNRLKSADRIYVDQKLDLGPIDMPASIGQGGRFRPWRPSLQELAELAKAVSGPVAKPAEAGATASSILGRDATVTSPYGLRANPFTGCMENHEGIDLAATPGTVIYAALPGKVVYSGWQSGYGKTVVIRHADGVETLYAHNQANLVQAGQEVSAQTAIGRVGMTGDTTGPHVHFEVRRNGRAVNPEDLVSRRLLQVAKAL